MATDSALASAATNYDSDVFRFRPDFEDGQNLENEEYQCIFCHQILRPPVAQLECGHRICTFECLDQVKQSGKCPGVDEECMIKDKICDKTIRPDFSMTRDILKKIAYCLNRQYGCGEKMVWKELDGHFQLCKFKPISCENALRGCEEMLPESKLVEHQKDCGYVYVICEFCTENILKVQLDDHVKECMKKKPICSFHHIGCQFEADDRVKISDHKRENVLNHLDLLIDAMKKGLESKANVQSYLNKFHEIATEIEKYGEFNNMYKQGLEKKLRSITKLVAKNSQEIYNMEEMNITEILGSIELRLSKSRDRLYNPGISSQQSGNHSSTQYLKKMKPIEDDADSQAASVTELYSRLMQHEITSFNGIFVHKVTPYAKLKRLSETTGPTSVYSNPFYFGRFGYKLCLRIFPNGEGIGKGKCMSVYLVLLEGEFDDLLVWPFKQRVTITLLDVLTHKKHIGDSFVTDPTSQSCGRPVNGKFKGIGFPLFAKQSDVESETYLKEDTVFIKVQVSPVD